MIENDALCLCGSGISYKDCCGAIHRGKKADNALQLMRSRYSAYALNLPDHIINTTHLSSPRYSKNKFSWKRSIAQFSQCNFKKLDIIDFKEGSTWATVTFAAHIFQGENDLTYTERSYFEKVNQRWLYRGGEVAEGYAPQLASKGPYHLLPIIYYNTPVLRQKADPVNEISVEIKKLVEDMVETMEACQGIGLAAPQVDQSLRIFVTQAPVERRDGSLEKGNVRIFINPKLSLPSEESWQASEGCLSIPAVHSMVERPREVTVEYTTLERTLQKQRFSGWEARVIMHENDHLNGVLFIDRLQKEEREKLQLPLSSEL